MPAVSRAQAVAAGIEYARRKHGGAPRRFASLSTDDLRHFAATPRKGLPARAASGREKRRRRIAEIRAGG